MSLDEAKLRESLRPIFEKFDVDGSGTVSTDEMSAMVKTLNMDLTTKQLIDMMVEADPDLSGAIDFEEFVNVTKNQIEAGNGGALASVVQKASSFFSLGSLANFMWGGEEIKDEVSIQDDDDDEQLRPSAFEIRTFQRTKRAYASSKPRGHHRSAASNSMASVTSLASFSSSMNSFRTDLEEDDELAHLQDLFSARESPLVASVYARYQVSQDNLARANRARAERAKRDDMRDDNYRQVHEEAQERRARVRGRNDRAREALNRRNLEHGRSIRLQREEIMQAIEEARQQGHDKVRARVLEANGGYESLDARLDAQEEAAATALRAIHSKAKRDREVQAQARKVERESKNKEHAEALREETTARLGSAMLEARSKKALVAKDKRVSSKEAKATFELNEREYMEKAKAAKAIADASRANAARARKDLEAKKALEVAAVQKVISTQVASAREAILHANRERRRAVFSARYVTRAAATEFAGSTFQKLYLMDDEADAQIDAANKDMFLRIVTVDQRTDDDIDDEAAGMARIKLAATSKALKAAEAARIQRDNVEIKQRLRATKASTDNKMDDEPAVARRRELALEGKARRAREAMALAVKNEEFQRRIRSARAVTDNDISDEDAGMARIHAEKAAHALREAEAARIARRNAIEKKALANVQAKTDDDVMDEKAGMARGRMAEDAKAKRASSARRLAKSNTEMRSRLKNVTAVVDDDVSDDAAGKARGSQARKQRWQGGDLQSQLQL